MGNGNDKNKSIVDWIKGHKIFCMLISILVCIGIPVFINFVMSYNLIPSVGTGNAEWLGFWGSFLGGIIGGIATLGGVLISVIKIEKDNEDKQKKSKAFLIPINKLIFVDRDLVNKKCYLHNEGRDNDLFSYDSICLDILNVGKEYAFFIDIKWIPPSITEVELAIQKCKLEVEFSKYYEWYFKQSVEEVKDVIQIVKTSDKESTCILTGQGLLLPIILEEVANQNTLNNLGYRRYQDIPFGIFTIECKDVYGNIITKNYKIELVLGISPTIKLDGKEYQRHNVDLNFKFID